ncbi:hypothetical protein SLA2020_222020 [Shorea laevis]
MGDEIGGEEESAAVSWDTEKEEEEERGGKQKAARHGGRLSGKLETIGFRLGENKCVRYKWTWRKVVREVTSRGDRRVSCMASRVDHGVGVARWSEEDDSEIKSQQFLDISVYYNILNIYCAPCQVIICLMCILNS